MKLLTSGLLFSAMLAASAGALLHCSSDEEKKDEPTTTGPVGAGGGTLAEAKQAFVTEVYPQLQANCANGCHDKGQRGAPPFIAGNADGSYTAIEGVNGYIAAPSQSPIRQKGLHSGPALTDKQGELVEKWLKLEVNARKLTGDNGKPPNLREGFRLFGKCMSYKRWVDLKLNELYSSPTQGNTGQCQSCHSAGQSSLFLSADPIETFMKFTTYPYVQKLVVGRVSASGAFDGLESSRRLMDKGTEARQPQANNHPQFTLTSEQTLNITLFVTETLTNMTSGTCEGDKPADAGAD